MSDPSRTEPSRSIRCIVALIIVNGWFCDVLVAVDPRIEAQLDASRKRCESAADWESRRAALREGFLRGARLWPLPDRPPLRVIAHSLRRHGDYSVENVAVETLPGFYCTGNLYRPVGGNGPHPAILCPHGHFTPRGRYRADQQIRCAQLARMGAVVFSYSMVGWQDSQQTTHDDPLVLALQTWNSIRVVDYLTGRADVDAGRIGVTGASGGGTQTFFLAAVDDRIAASAPVVIVYPWSWFSGACTCENGMPVMKEPETNAIELAAAAAPRPQLIVSCGLLSAGGERKDPTHDFPHVGFPFIREVYRRCGHPDRVSNLHLADEAHDFGPSKRQAVYTFFADAFGLETRGDEPGAIVIEPREALAVFGPGSPLPKHAARGSAAVAKAFDRLTAGTTSQHPEHLGKRDMELVMRQSSGPFAVQVERDPATGWDVIGLRYEGSGHTLGATVVPSAGMNACSLTVDGVELLRQPPTLEDVAGTAYGTPVLYPTPNRVRDARFTFDGRTFAYPPNERTHFLHGLVHSVAWDADDPMATQHGASITARLHFETGSKLYEQLPIEHTVSLTVALHEDGLRIEYRVQNRDESALPFGFALHPWFNYLSERRNTHVWVPAEARMATETGKEYALLPTGVLEPLDGHRADLRELRSLENVFLDDVFFGMTPARPAGYEDRMTGRRVTLRASADFTHMVVYTPKGGDSFCLENQTCSTDAHNLHAKGRTKEAHLQIVAPGESASGWVKFTVSTR